MQAKRTKNKEIKRQRGRPKLTGLSQTELSKLRMQKMRERKRKQKNLVPIEVWITRGQRDALLKTGKDLSALAGEAFYLLIGQQ
jgi:hypothetical protein